MSSRWRGALVVGGLLFVLWVVWKPGGMAAPTLKLASGAEQAAGVGPPSEPLVPPPIVDPPRVAGRRANVVPEARRSPPVQARGETDPRADADAMARYEQRLAQGDGAGALEELRALVARGGEARPVAKAALELAEQTTDDLEARRALTVAAASGALRNAEFETLHARLEALNVRPASSLLPLLDTVSYEVRPGDSLWRLCTKVFPGELGVNHEAGLIQLVNGVSSASLRVGQALLVPREQVTIRVDAAENGLVVMLGPVVLAAYRVGLGKEQRTPLGTFVIETKQENPPWYHDGRMIPFGDPENILGTRWMGFRNEPGASGYGIHGTAAPDSIGKNESMGCIRMRNEEVESLFLLVPRGTEVTIS